MRTKAEKWVSWPGLLAMLVAWTNVCSDDSQQTARQLLGNGDILPLEWIIEAVQHDQPGHILEVELEREHGVHCYQVVIVDTNGEVRELHYDASNGLLVHEPHSR